MSTIPAVFGELVDAIERHGCDLRMADEVKAVIDRHDVLVIDRSDGDSIEIDFGMRRGRESIIAHFFVYPADGTTMHVAYDIDWHGAPGAADQPEIERRSWSWDIYVQQPAEADEPSLFGILQ